MSLISISKISSWKSVEDFSLRNRIRFKYQQTTSLVNQDFKEIPKTRNIYQLFLFLD